MTWKHFIPLLMLTVFAAGCRIEPPLHLRQAMAVVVKVLWKVEVYPDGVKPTGVTLYFFRNGEFYMQHTTSEVDSCTVQLEPGRYRLYMITQSPEEYGTLEFGDMTDFDKAFARIAETRSRWYEPGENETVLTNPEMMAVGVSEEFEVSEEMVTLYHEVRTKADPDIYYYTILVPVYPASAVSQFWITIYSDNADVLKSVRASTSGMARTFMLTSGSTGPEEGTQIINSWTLEMENNGSRVGHLDGRITTFGFPRGELPSPDRDPKLNVSALLVDNQTVEDYVFFVGDKIYLEEPVPDGYRHLYRLVFGSAQAPAITPPDVKPPEGDALGGFDATVDDWEEGELVVIDM